jgi:signal peptidase II
MALLYHLRDALATLDSAQRRFLTIGTVACLIDLVTKEVAVRSLGATGQVPLTDGFALMLVWNTGAAGGFSLGPYTWHLNVITTIIAVALVCSVVRQMSAIDQRAAVAFGLVSGGAMGNLLSMLTSPIGVADFIGVRIAPGTMMVANVADFFLWSGAVLLVPVAATLVRKARAERVARAPVSESHVRANARFDALGGPGR